MAIYLDYNEWKEGVASWLDTTSGPVFNNTGTFIALAEQELDRILKLRQSTRFASNIIDNDGILTLPDDFAQMKSVQTPVSGCNLEIVTIDQYQDMWAASTGQTGQPLYYAIIGEKLHFIPLGADFEVQIAYYRKAVPLSDIVPENIYTKYAPEALLAGAVMYGFKFAADEDRLALWSAQFGDLIGRLNTDAQRGEFGSSPIKMRTNVRMPRHRRSF